MTEPVVTFLDGAVTLYQGDCRDALRCMADNSVDAVVTDPPYHLGFMGKHWDGGDIAYQPKLWVEILRVLKPGGHIVAFGSTRGNHRMVCAIEDAGFEIRDSLMWLYGTGFPKSHDVSKGIDKAAGKEREVVGRRTDGRYAYEFKGTANRPTGAPAGSEDAKRIGGFVADKAAITTPATDEAKQWEGWGTALKPACEPIVLARRPLSEKTVAANVLRWGTGVLNIDGCRVEGSWERNSLTRSDIRGGAFVQGKSGGLECEPQASHPKGRWPANIVHDGSDEVVGAFPDTGASRAAARGGKNPNPMDWGNPRGDGHIIKGHDDDGGSAARFFYSAKASKADRAGSKHPTVKPVALMQWLCRLITPPGGVVVDPFAGSGTTGQAAYDEGFRAILCEREDEYIADIARRMEQAPARQPNLFDLASVADRCED